MNHTQYKNYSIYETGNELFRFAFMRDTYTHGSNEQGAANTLEEAMQKIDKLESAK
jgi:hypothetical protein